ncbi:uncharacterized protein V1516DRAFT_685092 [Lipomyces oligophaga]|uniref:uncharacterized protein n=1 Tax=Lipomyces oligophaga TaxID=45792 RepID=UPI0034CEFFCD
MIPSVAFACYGLLAGLALCGQALGYTNIFNDLPVYDTPLTKVDHHYIVGPIRTSFEVDTVGTWGEFKHTHGGESIASYRPPVAFCPIGNHSFYFYGYSEGTNDSYYAGTGFAVAVSSLHPQQTVDIHMREDLPWGLMPKSTEDDSVGYLYAYLFVPRSPCVSINDTTSVQFWDAFTDTVTHGSLMTVYTLEDEGKTLRVDRPQHLYADMDENEYEYGLFASMVVHEVIYLYALDVSNYGNSRQILVARSHIDTVTDKSTWTYWTGSKWTAVEPKATAAAPSASVIYELPDDQTFYMSFSIYNPGASIFYSEYHHAYLMIFVSSADTSSYIIEYAPTPIGPWTTNRKVLYTDNTYDVTSSIVSPAFFSSPLINATPGKELLLTPISTDGNLVPNIQKLIFS